MPLVALTDQVDQFSFKSIMIGQKFGVMIPMDSLRTWAALRVHRPESGWISRRRVASPPLCREPKAIQHVLPTPSATTVRGRPTIGQKTRDGKKTTEKPLK